MSDIFISLIMTPCQYHKSFGGQGPFMHICYQNGLNITCMSNVFGRFLCDPDIKKLYICGPYAPGAHCHLFFYDLYAAFAIQDEAENYRPGESFSLKGTNKTILLKHPADFRPRNYGNCLILRFLCGPHISYREFDREDLAAFVYCGNTEDGPIDSYQCEYRDLCVNPVCDSDDEDYCDIPDQILARSLCYPCSVMENEGRLATLTAPPRNEDEVMDEGCFATPLGIPTTDFNSHFLHLI